jgi:outer membrane protein insertion porin family
LGDDVLRTKSLIIGLLTLTLTPALAAAEGEKLAAVVIKGNRRVESATILNAVKLKIDELYFLDKVDEDIRAIYKLGHFLDVTADFTNDAKGPTLTYTVTERPVVREIKIEGTKELASDKVRDALEVKLNSIFSQKALANSIKKVKKLYADEGYYLAEVTPTVKQTLDSEISLLLQVAEGDKVLISTISFDGNKAFTPRQLKKLMETGESWFMSWLTGAGTYKEDVLKSDAAMIADHYFNNGYINIRVGEPKVVLAPDKKSLLVTIGITEGDQFRVGSVAMKGELEKEKDLPGKLKLKGGEVFSRATLRSDVIALTDVYADKGYAFANIVPLTKVDPDVKSIDVTFDVEKGELVYIDKVNIRGNTKSRDKVLRREVKLAEGDLYSSSAIKRSKQSLMNLGYFEEATVAAVKGSSDNQLDLNVDVKEKPTGTFSIGAGYSSLDKFVGQGSVQQANFLGLGLKLNLAASIGGRSQTYNLGISDPYFMDTRWTLGGDIYRTEREYTNSYTRRATGADIKAGYPLTDTINSFLMYKYEMKDILKKSYQYEEAVRLGQLRDENSSTTSAVLLNLSRNSTDYRLDPTTGMVNNLSLEFAGLGGTNRYLRTVADSSLFFPGIGSTVFMTRATVGHVASVGKEVPIDEKFYLGGINTLRGYSSRTVSPYLTNSDTLYTINGDPSFYSARLYTGGNSEFYASAEWLVPLLKDAGLKGVVFFDIGNADDGFNRVFNNLLASYGGGIRWFSPIGPLRLEYGIPINPRLDIDAKRGRLEFSIGSFF